MNKSLIAFFMFFTASCFGQKIQQEGEHWYDVSIDHTEWNRLLISNEISKELEGDFSGLRIYSLNSIGDTIEIPYIIQNNLPVNKRLQMQFEVFNKNTKGDSQYITFKPIGKELLNRINLNIEEVEFDERVTLEGSNDQNEWFTILDDYRILSLNKDNIQFSYTDLEFEPIDYNYLRLKLPESLTFQNAYLLGNFSEGGMERDNKLTWHVQEFPDKKETEVYVQLDTYSTVRSFEIFIEEDLDYFRNSSLYYLADSTYYLEKWHKNYKRIYSGDLTSVRNHREIFNTVFTSELKFVIHNADNQPLTVKDIKVKGNVYSLVARFKEGFNEHYLFFQDRKTRAPSYDIERFKENIPEKLGLMSIGNSRFLPYPKTEKEDFFKSTWWIWGIMILVILVIGNFTIKMLKDA